MRGYDTCSIVYSIQYVYSLYTVVLSTMYISRRSPCSPRARSWTPSPRSRPRAYNAPLHCVNSYYITVYYII